jgi:zinc protease
MNKIICLLIGAAFTVNGIAQPLDRSKPPKPGPAPVITIKDPVIFNMPNGMTVLVVENHKLPKVSATLNIDRGPILEGNKAGVMNLMGQMLAEGTTKTPKAKFDESIDLLGADLALYSSGGSTSALTRYFDKAFMMMAEAIQNPAFPQESFDKLKTQSITGLKASEKSAAAISGRVVNALAYGKTTAMGEFETEETIKGLTLADIQDAYKNYMTPLQELPHLCRRYYSGSCQSPCYKSFWQLERKKIILTCHSEC